MEQIVTATEARVRFGELMRQVVERNQAVIVERGGLPQVVVLSVAEYNRLRAARPGDRRETLEQIAHLGDQILARREGRPLPPADEVIAEIREMRGMDHDRWHDLR